MKDKYGRNIDYVRISVTDRCNLRCIYCMPEKGIEWMPMDKILSYEEILRVVEILGNLGIRKVKITGGEPLVRKQLATLIEMIKATNQIDSVTLTTNGILLQSQLKELVDAGLDGVNISLDTLEDNCYQTITRGGKLADVLNGLKETQNYPNLNVKINCVPISEEPKDIISIAELAKNRPIGVRFIELMPIGYGKNRTCIKEEQLLSILQKEFEQITACEMDDVRILGNGPAHYYQVEGFQGRIGFISAISHQFCNDCNRIRLTSNGYLKTCLQYEKGIALRPLLHQASDEEIQEQIKKAIYDKPECHQFTKIETEKLLEQHAMSQIGG